VFVTGTTLPGRADLNQAMTGPCRPQLYAVLRLIHTYHAVPMPFPAALIHTCRATLLPFSDNIVSFVQIRVVDGNIRTASPATTLYSNNLRRTPRGSRKKPNAGRSPTCRLWTADANSHTPCRSNAAPMPRCAVALRNRFQNVMVVAWHVRIKHGRIL
jgi:hypothetical protein